MVSDKTQITCMGECLILRKRKNKERKKIKSLEDITENNKGITNFQQNKMYGFQNSYGNARNPKYPKQF